MSNVTKKYVEDVLDAERITIGTIATGSANANFAALICAALEYAEENGVSPEAANHIIESFKSNKGAE